MAGLHSLASEDDMSIEEGEGASADALEESLSNIPSANFRHRDSIRLYDDSPLMDDIESDSSVGEFDLDSNEEKKLRSGSISKSGSMSPSSNGLRALTRQLSATRMGMNPPLSPPPKKKLSRMLSLGSVSSPYNSPGSLSANQRSRAMSQGSLGGSLHGKPLRRSNSPGPLGGSLHGSSRRKNNSPGSLGGSLHGTSNGRNNNFGGNDGAIHNTPRHSSNSPGALGGSRHGKSHGRSTSPGPLGSSDVSGRSRNGSTSPGTLGGSLHGTRGSRSNSPGALGRGNTQEHLRSRSPGPLGGRPRSRSPGSLVGHNRSFRLNRRTSLTRRNSSKRFGMGPVSILRKGRFHQRKDESDTAESTASSPSVSPSPLDTQSGNRRGLPRLPVHPLRRVSFWFPDEESIAPSFATEESMQFGDLGLDDSDGEDLDYGRSMRDCTHFLDPTGMEVGEYGELALNDTEFGELGEFGGFEGYGEVALNGSGGSGSLSCRLQNASIEEELGASFGEDLNASFESLCSEQGSLLGDIQEGDRESSPPTQDKNSDDADWNRDMKRLINARKRVPNGLPTPRGGEMETTPRIENFKKCADSTEALPEDRIEFSSWGQTSPKGMPQDESINSDASSESPTSALDFSQEDQEKPSIPNLVPPIG